MQNISLVAASVCIFYNALILGLLVPIVHQFTYLNVMDVFTLTKIPAQFIYKASWESFEAILLNKTPGLDLSDYLKLKFYWFGGSTRDYLDAFFEASRGRWIFLGTWPPKY